MANSKHRRVFVGNIPYDVTEEQLVQICEEVGPVVSFRLVIDKETGKPKGYGFCEYKDEETALSARRNLHGYDINGRQLRVDFAENDKNNDKRQLGHGGPGLPSNTGPQKLIGGPAAQGDPTIHQPVGLQVAMAAAIVMTGQSQTNSNISQNGIQSQPTLGTDPLTLHLAKISKHQLTEVLTELKNGYSKQGTSTPAVTCAPTIVKGGFAGSYNAKVGPSPSVTDAKRSGPTSSTILNTAPTCPKQGPIWIYATKSKSTIFRPSQCATPSLPPDRLQCQLSIRFYNIPHYQCQLAVYILNKLLVCLIEFSILDRLYMAISQTTSFYLVLNQLYCNKC